MITQAFLLEFELSLLKAYTKTTRNAGSNKGINDHNFLTSTQTRGNFVNNFMNAFAERRALLEAEIEQGGHRNASQMFNSIHRVVEAKVTTYLLHKNSPADERSFQNLVRDLKKDVGSVFYEKYLSK